MKIERPTSHAQQPTPKGGNSLHLDIGRSVSTLDCRRHTADRRQGLTLIELLLATAIMAMLAVAATTLVSACLHTQNQGTASAQLHREGMLIMDRMANGLRSTTFVMIPNGHNPTRDILAFSRCNNADNDFYFGDPLFPRADEDISSKYMTAGYGILSVDDNGDGGVDNVSAKEDDDEDGAVDEDPLDGVDNDGDGSIDEDVSDDFNGDGAPGVKGMDDDGDGQVDEAATPSMLTDDDEDGVKAEEMVLPVLYAVNLADKTLSEIYPDPFWGLYNNPPTTVLSDHVAGFQAIWESPTLIRIILKLQGADGQTVTFAQAVSPRNVLQKTGKRVR